MRAPLLLLAALALTGCATAAQGAPAQVSGPATQSSASIATPSAVPNPDATTEITPGAAAVPPAPSASASSFGSAQPTPTASSLIDASTLGGPAPVESLVLGDSISLSIADDLSRYGYPVIGLVGQQATTTYLRTHLSSPLAQGARTWVIVLGTNNSGSPADVSQLADMVDLIDSLRTPGAKQQVRWVTPHRPAAYVGTKTAYDLNDFNAELSRLASEHRWLRILDFDVEAQAHPEWFDADTAMHLHPDSRGQAALVELITGPAPAPVKFPAPILNGAPTPSAWVEPPVFENVPLPVSSASPEASPEPTPDPSPDPALTPPTEPVASPVQSAPAGS